MRNFGLVTILFMFFTATSVFAAIPRKHDPFGTKPSSKTLLKKKRAVKKKKALKKKTMKADLALMALRLPMPNRIEALKQQGLDAVRSLRSIAFDKSKSLQVRWRAVTALSKVAPEDAMPELEQAMQSKEWFMRNAGIIAMQSMHRGEALKWSKRLLDDSALVVRTAAVDTIYRHGGIEAEALLWKKLNAEENFRGKESLWIRKHIVKALTRFARKGQEARFMAILKDADNRLHPYAIKALQKITGSNLGEKKQGLDLQRQAWLSWWSQRG